MAASTGILVAVGGIGAGNEFLHGHADAAIKISVATIGTAIVFAGIEQIPGGGREFAIGPVCHPRSCRSSTSWATPRKENDHGF